MPKLRSRKVLGNGKEDATLVFANIYLGPRSAASPSFISANGVTHVLSIGSTPRSTISDVVYHRLSLSDSPSSSIVRVTNTADTIIDAAKSGKILVHCSAGVSRSPTVVVAYLMKKHDMTLKAALGLVIRARPVVCPNQGFLQQLKELDDKLHGACSLAIDWLPAKKDDRLALFQA